MRRAKAAQRAPSAAAPSLPRAVEAETRRAEIRAVTQAQLGSRPPAAPTMVVQAARTEMRVCPVEVPLAALARATLAATALLAAGAAVVPLGLVAAVPRVRLRPAAAAVAAVLLALLALLAQAASVVLRPRAACLATCKQC